jgi:hypothetical protein
MRLLPHNPWLALPVAWLAFFALSLGVRQIVHALPPGPAWESQAILKVLLAGLALGAAALELLSPRALGFCRPTTGVWGRSIGGGLLLGVVTTLVILLAPWIASHLGSAPQAGSEPKGLRAVLGGYSFGALVVWVWIVSSVSEEVFCRGWFQASTGGIGASSLGALLPSALLFGGLHLLLLGAGVDRMSVAIIVTATTLLGLLAAWVRATSASIYPPIAAHVAFNVGGVIGGVAFAMVTMAVTGKMPFGAK